MGDGMRKVKISVQYKYLNHDVGAIPYINIGYINDSNEEMDAVDVLYQKINAFLVPNTGYYYGHTVDGDDFRVSEKKNIPKNVKYPYFYKKAKYNNIEDFKNSDVEILVKKNILESLKSFGSSVAISYCNYEMNGNIVSDTATISDLNTEKANNSLISEIHLNGDLESQCNYSDEDKVRFVSMLIIHLYESCVVRKIGFLADKEQLYGAVEFEVNGLSMDFIKNIPNYEEFVCNTVLNQVNLVNQAVMTIEKQRNKVKVKRVKK